MERPNRKTTLRKTLSNTSGGFTFVETIIAFSIVGIFLALTWGTVTFLLTKTTEQIERTRAHFLAVEGIELVKQIRLTALNRNRETGFLDAIGKLMGDFRLTKTNEEYSLTVGSNQTIEMNEEPYTTYCRTLAFSPVGDDPRQRIVTSTVRWGDPESCAKGEKLVSYSTLLADMTQ